MTLGEQLEQLCATGRREIILAAPFVKAHTLSRLLSHVRDNVTVRCVTRWRPEEIVAGVSDLAIWPLLRERLYSSLWLCNDLHGKYYRVDEQCLVGSANLTDTALGWAPQPNLELLVALPLSHAGLDVFESTIFARSITVDEALFRQISMVVDLMHDQLATPPTMIREIPATFDVNPNGPPTSDEHWLPSLRQPVDLFVAYAGRWDELTTTSRFAATVDLQALLIPSGLTKSAFNAYIGVLLLQKPLIRQIDTFLAAPQRFGAVRDFIMELPHLEDDNFDPSYAWQTLMRWLLHFLPMRYTRIPSRHSEILQRIAL